MRAGDHLAAKRGSERDHAIDLGDRTVMRFVPGAGVRRLSVGEFAAGADRLEIVVHRERTYAPAAVVARAFSRLSEAAFDRMFRSAEQFAAWCTSGVLPEAAGAARAPARRAGGAAGERAAPRPASRKAPKKAAPRSASRPRAGAKAGPQARAAPGRGARKGARPKAGRRKAGRRAKR